MKTTNYVKKSFLFFQQPLQLSVVMAATTTTASTASWRTRLWGSSSRTWPSSCPSCLPTESTWCVDIIAVRCEQSLGPTGWFIWYFLSFSYWTPCLLHIWGICCVDKMLLKTKRSSVISTAATTKHQCFWRLYVQPAIKSQTLDCDVTNEKPKPV